MLQIIDKTIGELAVSGNLRKLPKDMSESGRADFSSNDYLGIASRRDFVDEFLGGLPREKFLMSASASRLLARRQDSFTRLENTLAEAYGTGRVALLFNSGYHANTGLLSAFANTNTYVLADKLVHASIIDGIKLSGLPFARFRHNDLSHLDRLASKAFSEGKKLIILAESVYSMDGDSADIDGLADIKRRYAGSMLYLDEAHAVGVEGPQGLGLCKACKAFDDVDIIVGTFGKAFASTGAFAIMLPNVREYMVNRARSLIFSTALPPLSAEWSRFVFNKAMTMDVERQHLKTLGKALHDELSKIGGGSTCGHIQPLIVGDPVNAVTLSAQLRTAGFDVLPIRVPTVPPGTDRLRFSLSANLSLDTIVILGKTLLDIYGK